jgi:hypothetical protein
MEVSELGDCAKNCVARAGVDRGVFEATALPAAPAGVIATAAILHRNRGFR